MRYTIFDIPILRNLLQGLSIVVLKIFGWRRSGRLPEIPKYVMIAAPHTSNWDFPITLAIVFAFKMRLNLLRIVLGFLDYVRKVGGIGPTLIPTGNIESDMAKIRAFYDTISGKTPDKSAPAMIAPQG